MSAKVGVPMAEAGAGVLAVAGTEDKSPERGAVGSKSLNGNNPDRTSREIQKGVARRRNILPLGYASCVWRAGGLSEISHFVRQLLM